MLGSAALSSSGSKKAAKNATPKIPKEFRPDLGSALGLLGQRLSGGFQGMPGGALNPLQTMAMGQAGQSFGQGQAGLDSARQTIESLATTGIDPTAINTAQSTLQPYFDFLHGQGLAQTREGEAQGGRFFGSGGTGAEALFNSNFGAQQSAQILPMAMQMTGMRLGAANALPGFMAGQQGLGMNLFNMGGVAQQQQLAEFLRQQPENAIPLLAQLMSGTPMFQPPVPTNFGQALGGSLNSAMSSGGFWDYLRSLGGGGARLGAPATAGAGTSPGVW